MSSEGTIILEDGFGFVPRGYKISEEEKPFTVVRRYTMTNKNEASVRLISWGAGVQSIRVPNSRGIFGDVVLGFDDMEGYLKNRYIGRVINIMPADNSTYEGDNNRSNLDNDWHKSIDQTYDNFDNVNWESCVTGNEVVMSYVNRLHKQGNLGDMLAQVKYSWADDNVLNVKIRATVTKPMPANITIYCPMNLSGHAMGARELENHVVTVNSDNLISINPRKNWVEMQSIERTIYDLRKPTRLKKRLYKIPGGGYDHYMRVNSPSSWCYRYHGRILHPETGRFLEIYSDKANLKFSTGKDLLKSKSECPPDLRKRIRKGFANAGDNHADQESKQIRGKDGAVYRENSAFVFSPQNCPNEKFPCPDCILHPGEVFIHSMSYRFGVKSKKH